LGPTKRKIGAGSPSATAVVTTDRVGPDGGRCQPAHLASGPRQPCNLVLYTRRRRRRRSGTPPTETLVVFHFHRAVAAGKGNPPPSRALSSSSPDLRHPLPSLSTCSSLLSPCAFAPFLPFFRFLSNSIIN
jgi:hypothetical protein